MNLAPAPPTLDPRFLCGGAAGREINPVRGLGSPRSLESSDGRGVDGCWVGGASWPVREGCLESS